MKAAQPQIVVFAGPNGSGKSTITREPLIVGDYINADVLVEKILCNPLEAAQKAEEIREWCLENKKDFTFETVLSTRRNLDLLTRARAQGYFIIAFYTITKHPNINVERVRQRVLSGGHDVPEVNIVERYRRATALLPELIAVCDNVFLIDNSIDSATAPPQLLFTKQGCTQKITPSLMWSKFEIELLVRGQHQI